MSSEEKNTQGVQGNKLSCAFAMRNNREQNQICSFQNANEQSLMTEVIRDNKNTNRIKNNKE